MIKLILSDIDGVLTNGKFIVSSSTPNAKMLCFKDLDAVALMKKNGIGFGLITGEKDQFTFVCEERFQPDIFVNGCKNKAEVICDIAFKQQLDFSEICYIGDGKYDIDALKLVGLGICPSDAIDEVKQVSNYILKREGGNGCLAELYTYIEKLNWQQSARSIFNQKTFEHALTQHINLANTVLQSELIRKQIDQIVSILVQSLRNGGQILFCGNGGSAADAQHLSTELVSRFYMERKAYNAEALSVNTSTITAIGNDYSYDRIFARQVEAKGKAGDVLFGITTSGGSKNIIEALKTAKDKNMNTIIFTGGNEKKNDILRQFADIVVAIPNLDTPRIQEMHIILGHIICECVEKEMSEI